MLLPDPQATEQLGRALGGVLQAGDVVALNGPLGAGKTTLARGALRGVGYSGEVASPTFPIVQPYDSPELRLPVWHVDLYRIEERAELEQLALEEALDCGALLVEWPERAGSAAWPHALGLELAVEGEGVRSLTAHVPPAWEGRWPPR